MLKQRDNETAISTTVWNGSAFVADSLPNRALGAIPLSESGATGIFLANAPTIPNTGNYPYIAFKMDGSSVNFAADAAAVPTNEPLKSAVYFNGVYYPFDDVVVPKPGDKVIAIGRGTEPGIGIYEGLQTSPVNVDTGYQGGVQLSGQYVVGQSFYGPLAIPGFSGGPAFTLTVDSNGIHRHLIGMVIAGDGSTTYVTPVAAIETALQLHVKL